MNFKALIILASFASTQVLATESKNSLPHKFSFHAEGGTSSLLKISAGRGGLSENKEWQKFGLSYLTAESEFYRTSKDKSKYTSLRFNYSSNSMLRRTPYKASVFFYRNNIEAPKGGDSLLDRYGFGIGLGGGVVFGNFKVSVEGEILPQFLSTEWEDNVETEYAGGVSFHYLLDNNALITIQASNHGMIYDGASTTIYNSASLGIDVSF